MKDQTLFLGESPGALEHVGSEIGIPVLRVWAVPIIPSKPTKLGHIGVAFLRKRKGKGVIQSGPKTRVSFSASVGLLKWMSLKVTNNL